MAAPPPRDLPKSFVDQAKGGKPAGCFAAIIAVPAGLALLLAVPILAAGSSAGNLAFAIFLLLFAGAGIGVLAWGRGRQKRKLLLLREGLITTATVVAIETSGDDSNIHELVIQSPDLNGGVPMTSGDGGARLVQLARECLADQDRTVYVLYNRDNHRHVDFPEAWVDPGPGKIFFLKPPPATRLPKPGREAQ